VVSARGDLSGAREMQWAADDGELIGAVHCTRNFQFDEEKPAIVRPTMLLCWHITARRSVYVVAVDLDQPPSEQAAASTIERVWKTLH
jgi:hypothetical protein